VCERRDLTGFPLCAIMLHENVSGAAPVRCGPRSVRN
jgi:hypothetical protein